MNPMPHSPFKRIMALVVIALGWSPSATAARSFYVAGTDGVPLAVSEVGPNGAPAILFLHGLGQGRESFAPQFSSSLATKYHLVAFDLRGHAMSGKPWDESAYTNPETWAGDVQRVIAATGLKRPVIVAWSYGTLVAADYIRAQGAKAVAGLILVSSLGGLVDTAPPAGPVPPDLVRSRQLRAGVELADQREAQRLLAPYLTGPTISSEWRANALAMGTMVPPFVDVALRKHKAMNRDLVTGIGVPVLIIFGKLDTAIQEKAVNKLVSELPRGRASRFDESGHSPFAEDPERFNQELSRFVDSASQGEQK